MASPTDKPLLHGLPPYALTSNGCATLSLIKAERAVYRGVSLSERQKELVTGFLIIGIMVGGWGVGEPLLRLVQHEQFGTAANVETSPQFYSDQQTALRLPVPNSTQRQLRINSRG